MTIVKKLIKATAMSIVTFFLTFHIYGCVSSSVSTQINEEEYGGLYNNVVTNGKNIYPATIRLQYGYDFFCSGVVIDGQYALTAAHCVQNTFGGLSKASIDIYDISGNLTNVTAIPVAFDKLRDVALIKGNFRDFNNMDPDFTGETQSDILNKRIRACGFPSGGDLFCSNMVLIGNYDFQLNAQGGQLYKGMSGGPVIDATTQKVIGVNSAVSRDKIIIGPIIGVRPLWGI